VEGLMPRRAGSWSVIMEREAVPGERERRVLGPRTERSLRDTFGEWRCGERVTSGWMAEPKLNDDLLASGLVCVPAWLTDFGVTEGEIVETETRSGE